MAEPYTGFDVPLRHADETEHRRQLAQRVNQSVLEGAAPGVAVFGQMPEAVTSGALSLDAAVHQMTAGAGSAYTLADGIEGQLLVVVKVDSGGTGTLTPTNLHGGVQLAFTALGDSAQLLFTGAAWAFIGGQAVLS